MEVRIRDGGYGVQCWNGEPIVAYARNRAARQAQLTAANPDLVAISGRITCHGCTALEYGQGFGCTARLTQTLFQVRGEIAPGGAAGRVVERYSRVSGPHRCRRELTSRTAVVHLATHRAIRSVSSTLTRRRGASRFLPSDVPDPPHQPELLPWVQHCARIEFDIYLPRSKMTDVASQRIMPSR